jgi:hypothetical protein
MMITHCNQRKALDFKEEVRKNIEKRLKRVLTGGEELFIHPPTPDGIRVLRKFG